MAGVMTNMGPRSRKESGRAPGASSPGISDGGMDPNNRSASPMSDYGGADPRGPVNFSLPPIGKGSTKVMEQLDTAPNEAVADGVSPVRRSRKSKLMAYGDGQHRSIIQAGIDIDQREKEMTLARENRREYGRVLLELWVNQVLDPGSVDLSGKTDPLKFDPSILKGLASYGLTRIELLGAGLSNDAIDRLYRCMYVYTIGFFDVMQDILQHSEFRTEILSNVWKGFLAIAESALHVAFKSDYLQLFQAQQMTAAELLVAKEALAEARQDSVHTEKAIAWLTQAHAEERALRQGLKSQLEEVGGLLEKERRAHQAAVQKYVQEVESKAKLHLDLEAANEKLVAAALAQVELVQQRDTFKAERDVLQDRCETSLGSLTEVYEALTLDEKLSLPPELAHERIMAQGSGIDSLPGKSAVIRALASQLYKNWRDESNERKALQQELFATRDKLRDTKAELFNVNAERQRQFERAEGLSRDVDKWTASSNDFEHQLKLTQQALEETNEVKAGAEAEVERLSEENTGLNDQVKRLSEERAQLRSEVGSLSSQLAERDAQLAATSAHLERTSFQLKECSKGLAVAMRSLYTNQMARNVLQRKLHSSRQGGAQVSAQLDMAERKIRMMEAQVANFEEESQALRQIQQAAVTEKQALEKTVHEAMMELETKKAAISALGEKVDVLNSEINRLMTELQRTVKRAEAAEEGLAASRAEAQRLYESLQSAEGNIQAAADEQARLLTRLEATLNEKKSEKERHALQEEMMTLEIQRLTQEVEVANSKLDALNLQLEILRQRCEDLDDALVRKRQKKQKWKKLHTEQVRETDHLREMLGAKDQALEALDARILPLQQELACLMADRGREFPVEDVAAQGSDAALGGLPPEDSLASAGSVDTPSPSRMDPTLGALAGKDPADVLTKLYLMWERSTHQMTLLQDKLDEQNRELDRARRAYEKARAIYYANPSDPGLKEKMLGREADLATQRAQRADIEEKLAAASKRVGLLQHKCRQWENEQANRRITQVQAHTGKVEEVLRSELGSRLDDAEARTTAVRAQLEDQVARYERIQEAYNAAEAQAKAQEAELRTLADKLSKLTNEKIELEGQLKQARSMITHLQTEGIALTKDRDNARALLQDAEAKIGTLNHELESAGEAISGSMRRLEQQFAAEKESLQRMWDTKQGELEARLAGKEGELKLMTVARDVAHSHLRGLITHHYVRLERQLQPAYLFYLTPDPEIDAAQKVTPTVVATNFNLLDPVVQYCTCSFEMTLVLISMMYIDKITRDIKGEEMLLGGKMGGRCSMEDVMYDFFLSRYGIRAVAEAQLAAFLNAILRYRAQHPKIRVFARLLGLPPPPPPDSGGKDESPVPQEPSVKGVNNSGWPEEEPLPPQASEFYVTLLARVHGRVGPLVSECSEGYSFVKMRVLGKLFREMLRGSYSTLNDEAASISDTLRAMAVNDEERPIDLELSLELALKCFLVQYRLDHDSVSSTFRHLFDNRRQSLVTPDEFIAVLKQLDSVKSDHLEPERVLSMYRRAARTCGPGSEALTRALVSAILDGGYVGITTHLSRHEAVKDPPPFDEFRLLEESWKNMRVVVEAQLHVLHEHKELRADVNTFVETARKLELDLELREAPQNAWATYRKLLTLYATFKKPVDEIQPFRPPMGSAASSLGSLLGSSRPGTNDPAAAGAQAAPDSASVAGGGGEGHERNRRAGHARIQRQKSMTNANMNLAKPNSVPRVGAMLAPKAKAEEAAKEEDAAGPKEGQQGAK